MAETLDWILYDLNGVTNTASQTVTFFDTTESASGIAVTNMEVAGQLASTQRFTLKKIQLLVDQNAADGDSRDLLDAAVLKLVINGRNMLQAPANQFVGGPNTMLVGATTTVVANGNEAPFEFEKPIVIPGGVPFKVEFTAGKSAVSATTDLTIMLVGMLDRP